MYNFYHNQRVIPYILYIYLYISLVVFNNIIYNVPLIIYFFIYYFHLIRSFEMSSVARHARFRINLKNSPDKLSVYFIILPVYAALLPVQFHNTFYTACRSLLYWKLHIPVQFPKSHQKNDAAFLLPFPSESL